MTLRRLVLALPLVVAVVFSSSAAEAQYYGGPPGPPPPPPSQGINRQGLVVGFALGGGTMHFTCNGCTDFRGLAAEFHIGGMITPQLAIMFDASTVIYFFGNGGSLASNFGAAAVQLWVNRILWLKGGLGLGQLTTNDTFGYTTAVSEVGFGGLAAIGVELLQSRRFAMDLQLRASTTHYGSGTSGQAALMLGFNWY